MTNYFSHDVDATNDIRLQNLIMKMGYEGLGFYWHIVEMLYKQDGKIELSQCDGIAFAMRTDSEKIQQLISVVFEKDSKYFWSNTVLKRLKIQKEKSKVAKNSAQKRWKNEAKNGNAPINANAMPTHSEGNAIKEKKIKENKRNIYIGELEKILIIWKEIHPEDSNKKSYRTIEDNYFYWREEYTFEQIEEAIRNSINDEKFLKNISLETFFRQKNKGQEKVDYISQALRIKPEGNGVVIVR